MIRVAILLCLLSGAARAEGTVLVVNSAAASLSVVDRATRAETAQVGRSPHGLFISPTGH